jgi:Tol biopolymer transport system component
VGADQLDSCWQKNDTYRADPLCRFKGTAIYVEDIDANELRRLATNAIDPTWSPDGSTLAFSLMDKRGQVDVWATNADGASLRQITNTVDPDQYPIWVQR